MNGRSKKYSVITLVFLLYFFFYAISPLSYSHAGEQSNKLVSGKTAAYMINFSLFLIEFLGSNAFEPGDEYDSSTIRFILLKNRAILSSHNLTQTAIQSDDAPLTWNDVLQQEVLRLMPRNRNDKAKFSIGFASTCSGLSPPYVSFPQI
jgi:hypothetical protein